MDSLIAQVVRKERRHVRLLQVDIDERPDLTDRFGVRAAPTLILVKQGLVVERIDGRMSAAEIERLLEAHLIDEVRQAV
jgi:thioredoxin-like negative regulator of GroEL